MLLALDIGNTNVVVGLYEGDRLATSWRLATDRSRMPDEWWATLSSLARDEGIDLRRLDGAGIASGVPRLTEVFSELIERRLGRRPVLVSAALDLGIPVRVDYPSEVGPDRLADAVAVRERHGAPSVVVDFGTGTNFDVVSPDGAYIGGAIAPGVQVALDALTGRAARLSSVVLAMPPQAIGRNTVHAIQSGTVLGYVALVEGLLARIGRELGAQPAVVATGGLGALFVDHIPAIGSYEPDLTLEGVRLIYERVTHR